MLWQDMPSTKSLSRSSIHYCRLICQFLMAALTMGITVSAAAGTYPGQMPLDVGSGERLLVVEPHPDDGVIAAAGLAQRVLALHGSVWVAVVTCGDGFVQAVMNETGQLRPPPTAYISYGERRLEEARAAWRQIGGDHTRLKPLGFPDAGLMGLLLEHWFPVHPECSKTTWACDPPYDEAVDPDVLYCGANLREELVGILREANPTIVAFPDPLDQHPDHRAAGLFTLLAIDEWTRREPNAREAMPRLLAYLVHWFRWPVDSEGQTPSQATHGPLDLPQDLPGRGLARTAFPLTDPEMATKRAALSQFVSQQKWMAAFLTAFVSRTEPFTMFTETQLREAARMAD